MAVDAREFHRELESVCDIFKIPSLYSEQEKCLEALFKRKRRICKSSKSSDFFEDRGGCTQGTRGSGARLSVTWRLNMVVNPTCLSR